MLTDVITYFQTPTALSANPPSYNMIDINDQKISQPSAVPPEAEWQKKLKTLERKIRKYNWTKRGDEAIIVESMRDLAASHSDPQVQTYWTRRANEFEIAPDSDKKAILLDIARGIAILFAAPFAIAGAILMGAGMLLKASGDLLTGGKASALTK
ncbi:hypothetical protein B0H17DRAFT_1143645 [Mycena rosella]|uniref:Uncharacterized protein n=1 Tax=Mycena rosella TaxID=1033263 RepID=A0AAD7G7X1_MYCRO|nr:hypothetical protein B0H17DRAFT_1143645 [Mycena rosella]